MALKEGCEWLFFLDSDVVPGNDVVFRLMSHNIPLVSGLYWRRHPNLEPCMYKLSPEGIPVTFQPHEVGQGILQEAEAAGAGCLLINKIVLEKMAPTVESFELLNAETKETMVVHKFFEYIIKDKVTLSEDVVFFSRAKNLGFKLMVDTGVRCGHLSTAMVKEGRFNYTPLTLGYEI
ncbi:MAG: hypothetical protein QW587_04580 [Candidatus Bathyarchaeia archaeon]